MNASLDSDPSLSTAGGPPPAGLGAGERSVVAGRYRLTDLIAQGGMGSVYRAEHVLSRKKLAVKVVHPYLCKGRQGVERFRREVSAAAEIDHPGIVQVYDAGVDDDGGFFMAMELLEGESLGDLMRRDWPGMASAVQVIDGLLEPLAKAHAKGFVHRDLKPDNVFLVLDEEGRRRVKILDFGLAREIDKGGPTRTGITFGTPEYMSPEQAISARKVRAPGDVWSVGVMLYELLSGEHPFSGETPNAVMANAIKEPLPPLDKKAPHVPEPLAKFVERCLQKSALDRPQDAGEMLDGLRAVLAGLPSLSEVVPHAPIAPPQWNGSEGDDRPVRSSSFPLEPPRPVEARLSQLAEAPPRRDRTAYSRLLFAISALLVLGLAAFGGAQLYYALAPAPPTSAAAEMAIVRPAPSAPPLPIEAEARPPVIAPAAPSVGSDVGEASVEAELEAPNRARTPARRRERNRHESTASSGGYEEARECAARGDRRCVIRVLEGRARSAQEQALLIDAYQQSGNYEAALARMRRFVRSFPRAPQTATYRETLARFSGG